jgi:hypothetical protein
VAETTGKSWFMRVMTSRLVYIWSGIEKERTPPGLDGVQDHSCKALGTGRLERQFIYRKRNATLSIIYVNGLQTSSRLALDVSFVNIFSISSYVCSPYQHAPLSPKSSYEVH